MLAKCRIIVEKSYCIDQYGKLVTEPQKKIKALCDVIKETMYFWMHTLDSTAAD